MLLGIRDDLLFVEDPVAVKSCLTARMNTLSNVIGIFSDLRVADNL
jgi:hypothetical protein